jgi:ferredoxin-nitrite reductase
LFVPSPLRNPSPAVSPSVHPVADACPGLFYPTFAQDGRLIRIRTPGGRLSAQQARVLAKIGACLQKPFQVTNRANLQMRGLPAEMPIAILQQLQASGLAAPPQSDHLRNIMASPTAGIDPAQLIDTMPYVQELDAYLSSHPHLSPLSAKFSIGFDGGEQIAIASHNDLQFTAIDHQGIHFCLHIAGIPTMLIPLQECISAIVAVAQVYLEASLAHTGTKKLRLKEMDISDLCDRARLSFPIAPAIPDRAHQKPIGIHPQRQPNYSYIGVVLPLGKIEAQQLNELANIAENYGDGTLRLTPWQNILLPNIPNHHLAQVQTELPLPHSPHHIHSALIACAGNTCASSATDTQAHALILADYLHQHITLDMPLTIHFSGCLKSCARHDRSDITLIGTRIDRSEAYQLYVGSGDLFGKELYSAVYPQDLPKVILQLIQTYHQQHLSNESLGNFVDRHSIPTLRQWLNSGGAN